MIDAAVGKHLEVLSGMRFLGLGIVKGIDHRGAIERTLHSAVHALGKG